MVAKIPQSVREEQLNSLLGKRFVRWLDGYKNQNSKAVMMCDVGHEWVTTVTNSLNNRGGCPHCAGKYVYSATERVEQLNARQGMRFVRWVDNYRNQKSKAVMRCDKGHEWSSSVRNLINQGTGCPNCHGNYQYSVEEREEQLNAIKNMKFVRWLNQCVNQNSKAVMVCNKGHEWSARISDLVNRGRGCPTCAQYGFDPLSAAALYALRSECGEHVKVGISKDVSRRVKQLSRDTPFNFSVISTVDGVGHDIRDLEKVIHSTFESSGFSGFSGATEWLKFDPDILSLLRILGA